LPRGAYQHGTHISTLREESCARYQLRSLLMAKLQERSDYIMLRLVSTNMIQVSRLIIKKYVANTTHMLNITVVQIYLKVNRDSFYRTGKKEDIREAMHSKGYFMYKFAIYFVSAFFDCPAIFAKNI
jgi:hypothetical protein